MALNFTLGVVVTMAGASPVTIDAKSTDDVSGHKFISGGTGSYGGIRFDIAFNERATSGLYDLNLQIKVPADQTSDEAWQRVLDRRHAALARMDALRDSAVAKGMALLDEEGLRRAFAERRGEDVLG